MKTLLTLTLMLVSFNLFGQGQPFKSIQIDTAYHGIYIDTICCTEFMSRDEFIVDMILDNTDLKLLIDYYAEDCENNKEYVKVGFGSIDTCRVLEAVKSSGINDYYIEPDSSMYPYLNKIIYDVYVKKNIKITPTFEGFINWMDNKLK